MASCAATPNDTGPQCGPRKRRRRAFDGIPLFFQGFCAIGHVTSNMGDGSRFDVLLPSMLTAVTNLAVSTVAWQRNFRLFCKRGEQRCQNSTEKKKVHQQCLCPPYFGVWAAVCSFAEDSTGLSHPTRQTAVLGLCGRLSVKVESRGDSSMDCTTVIKKASRHFLDNF